MKKILTLTALVCFLSVVHTNAQVGLQAGAVAVPDEAFIPYDSLEKVSGAIGYTFGVFYKYWLTDHISVQPALNLLNKRWWEELDDGGTFYITRVSMNYIELPVQVVYTTSKTKGLFVGAGPSFMVGLSGKRTVTEDGDLIATDKIRLGSENAPEKKLTIAVNAMAGYTFKHISVGLNYTRGITNQPVADADHGNVSQLTLRVSFLFGEQ
ncbi:MAG: PorT family protein [Cyclobacteriaceae bacterium]|nr:PorT family protein [Cyclobacteriaceae bacterium]